jgi:hypothetical protein
MSASPYEVLGVTASASNHTLRKAFRKALRETHPDTGGDPARFTAVQLAWERIGTPEKRAVFDGGRTGPPTRASGFDTPKATPRKDSRPRARSYGYPGGWRREQYLAQLREWAGRGASIPDPYDPLLVRSAPREIRHTLADALAEEATARLLSALGIGYTVWHDVATSHPNEKVDHIVLGPTGLFAMMSEDFGGPVQARKGELLGEAVGADKPMHVFAARARSLSRSLRVSFSGLVMVLPDDALEEPLLELGSIRGAPAVAVRQSQLPVVLRAGLSSAKPIGGNELFDIRTRVNARVRFV